MCSHRPHGAPTTTATCAEVANMERNVEKLLESIDAVANADCAALDGRPAHAPRVLPFIALKLTAISPPRFLVRIIECALSCGS